MIKFIIKTILFCALFYALAFVLQNQVDNGIKKSGFDNNYREWNDIFGSKINADLLVLGSSRAWVHFSPRALDSCFQINSYNLGIDGYEFLMQYYRFKTYLEYNKKPKFILLSLDVSTLAKREGLYEINQFIPYLGHPLIREVTRIYLGFGLPDYYIPLWKYSKARNIGLTGIRNIFNDSEPLSIKYKGFLAQDRAWDNSFDDFKAKNPDGVYIKVDSLTKQRLTEFISFCHTSGIKVVFAYSPEYFEVQGLTINRKEIFEMYEQLSDKYTIPFLDFSNDSINLDKNLFYNSQHLNRKGVEAFTKRLLAELGPILEP